VDAWLESKKVYPVSGGKKMSHLSVVNNAKDVINNAVSRGKLPWTPRAKAVLKHAEKQAQKDKFELVGTEHLVCGFFTVKECLAAMIFKNLGLTESDYLRLYDPLRPVSPEKGSSETRFSEDIDKVIQNAYEQSTQWGHEYIGAEHLLVGILMSRAGAGFEILTELGITLEKVREETRKLIVCHNAQTERTEK
jgi:ATP-dependent Clp protease ATP-binding subunit ClpC